ncbi:hypothetical protein AWC09_13765 [Mycolicibacter hiberniae]|nr:hypothetical protein AWC09_13765 [Mycolicibacter hiberniae]
MTSVHTEQQRIAAKAHLCETYSLAADAEHVETNGDDPALARISLVNGAGMLESATSDPALEAEYGAAAKALAQSYRAMAAGASLGSEDSVYKSALKAVIAQESVLKLFCGQ